ncbi:MAG: GNAT family N-acetyltransferase/peptidase C39 family protein [Gammaproteobacteria bacterium]
MIRAARLQDIDALVAIEQRCFETDRLSRRSFRYMLTKANGATLVDESDGVIRGYVLVLFHAGTSLARLYSIAVDPQYRGQSVGRVLVEAAEQSALDHDCAYMRLEVRRDNDASIALFRRLGYRQFGRYEDYYEDHMEALRFEKPLGTQLRPELALVPYYEQTLDFTCGPSTLMMAMKALDPDVVMNRRLEIRLWRESTTVFMTAGHGGCGPYGLALSAYHRGFDVEIYVNDESALFVDSVRSDEKKEVIRLVQEDFVDELERLPIPIYYQPLRMAEMKEKFDEGAIPVVLISSYRIYQEKFPHWVVVTGFDERFVYVHDPYVDYEKGKTRTDSLNMPISQKDFERMTRYGKSGQRAALIIRKRRAARRRPAA